MTSYPAKLADAAFLADPGVKRIFALLGAAGHEARVVGGAVRNTLMGRGLSRKPVEGHKFDAMAVGAMGAETSDIDICTTATPDEVMRIGEAAERVHAVPTGFDHGTVTLVIDRVPYEVTTLREDVETDGRRAKVRFGTSFEKDAYRRDFTMNALSCEADGTVHDYASGVEDVAARRVRFIGDADQRIREDFLRILRLFRFSAAYGEGAIDADGLAAAIRHRDGLRLLSRERIGQETMKLVVQPHAAEVVATMAEHGFLDEVLGGPADVERFTRMCAIEARLGEAPGAARRLAALAVFAEGDAERLQERLRLSGVAAERLGASNFLTSGVTVFPPTLSLPSASGGRGRQTRPSRLRSPPPIYGGEGQGGGNATSSRETDQDRSDPRTPNARRLRRNATPFEKRLWTALRDLDLPGHFRRQVPVGPYYADFAHLGLKLIIELDGEQHGHAAGKARDERRDRALRDAGYQVLRFWNSDVADNFDGVVETILARIAEIDPSSGVFPAREFWPAELAGQAEKVFPPTLSLPSINGGRGRRQQASEKVALPEQDLRTFLHRLGPKAYRDAVMAAWTADGAGADDPGWREAYELPCRWTPPAFTISGKDLIAAGMTPGPALGEMLKRIEEAWIAAGMPEGREAQMQILREHL